ncbi:MAG: aminotransferase class V-fold PLP-dependent enzyme [Candidatus Marinimicrobia bacterium]|nr:aminotransferase class V-fold PLP-dependent enzyme [Candidatus Neomarinimicrobiota bacterium]
MDNYRKLFPITQEKVYLNHAATAPLSTRVKSALDKYIETRMKTQPGNWEESAQKGAELKQLFAGMIKAESADRIAFTQNTTHGLNIIASGLNWQPGDEILIPEKEFPANVYPFKNLEKLGVKIKYLPTPQGGLQASTLTDNISPKTKLLTLSFVEYLSGFKHDMEAIGQICQEYDILFIVDSIQGAGAMPIDVQNFHIDGLANGGQKWLMSPPGTGFLYVTKDLQGRISQCHLGWTGLEDFDNFLDYDRKPLETAARYELGSLNFAGITAAHAALSLLTEVGLDNIYQHIVKLTDHAIHGLKEAGYNLYTNQNRKHRSGIVTFYPDSGVEQLFEKMQENDIVCSFRSNMIRIAPHFYNNFADIEAVLDVCRKFR